MIPGMHIDFSEGEKTRLIDYIHRELNEALDEHNDREYRLLEWDKAYAGEPKQAKRNFPWPGAANVEIPLIGITVDSIVARIINTVFAMEPFWTIRGLNKNTDKMARPLQDYIEWSRRHEFDLYKAVRSNVIELVKYGWSWYKYGWEVYTKPQYITGPDGLAVRKDEVIRRPNIYHVLNRDVITQAGVEDEVQAEWLCHRVRLTDNQMRLRQFDGVYAFDLDKTIKMKEDASEYHESLKPSRMSSTHGVEKLNTIYEVYVEWPYLDDVPVPIVIAYHRETRQVGRAVFNAYPFRPLKKIKFIEREGQLEGMGIAKRLWQLQEELSTLHRQQIDNSTLANTRFFVGRRNVVRSNTQIWPGRVLLVNDPSKDLIPYQMGDIYQSQGMLESRALAYSERASGVSDYQLGRESSTAGSRATATSTLALIQEGNRRFDLNIRDMRESLSHVGRDIILLNQMFRPKGIAYFVQGQDGQYTEALLNLPPEFSVAKLAVELTATTATINKEIEKQGLMGLLGIVNQYYEKLIQVGLLVMNPQIPPEVKDLAVRSAEGAKYLLERIVQTFDVKAIDTIIPGLVNDANAEIGGADRGPAGAPANGGMGNVPGLLGQSPGNGTGGPGGFGGLQ